MSDESALSISPTREELKALDVLLSRSRERKGASPFLRSLCRSFLLAPEQSEERAELSDMVSRVAAESGVEAETLLRATAAELVAEGLL
jgi:hypothetical protein